MKSFFFSFGLCFLTLCFSSFADEQSHKISAFFSSVDRLDARVIEQIDQETHSVHLAIYQFTHPAIAEALIRAKKRGVDVEIVVDAMSVRKRSPLARMAKENISIFVWAPFQIGLLSKKRRQKPLMHHKFCVLGRETVWTGSYNFTKMASENHQENVIIFQGSELADLYEKEFESLKKGGSLPYSDYVNLIQK